MAKDFAILIQCLKSRGVTEGTVTSWGLSRPIRTQQARPKARRS